jgi:hypothetical protein
MSAAVARLIRDLSAVELDHVFNPYAQRCPLFDRADAAARRRRNLEIALHAALDAKVATIWIARDLGYRGGRRTGLALTDEPHLDRFSQLYGGVAVRRATKGPPVAERTARVIWQMLDRIAIPVFLWNVFPFHPHRPAKPLSNRCHSAAERRLCERLLHDLLALLQPDRVFAVGGDAHRAMAEIGVDCTEVRHPSYGGQALFIRQIEAAYEIEDALEPGDLLTPPSPAAAWRNGRSGHAPTSSTRGASPARHGSTVS